MGNGESVRSAFCVVLGIFNRAFTQRIADY